MRVLITGVAGQDGTILSHLLSNEDEEIIGIVKPGHESADLDRVTRYAPQIQIIECDISDKNALRDVVIDAQPDQIFNLGGISSIVESIQNPELTFAINVGAIQGILEGMRTLKSRGKFPRLVAAASGTIFEGVDRSPQTEDTEISPGSPYAQSKAEVIGVLMVLAVISDPLIDRTLDRHPAHDRESDLDWPSCFEGAVGEETVIADGDAQSGDRPEHHEQCDIDPGQPATPGDGHRSQHGQERHHDEDADRESQTAGHLDIGGLNGRWGWRDRGHGTPSSAVDVPAGLNLRWRNLRNRNPWPRECPAKRRKVRVQFIPGRLAAGQRTLNPSTEVRSLPREPHLRAVG